MSSGRPPQSSSGGDVASKTRYDRGEHDFKNDREHVGCDCEHCCESQFVTMTIIFQKNSVTSMSHGGINSQVLLVSTQS